jgi:hypothetical protein
MKSLHRMPANVPYHIEHEPEKKPIGWKNRQTQQPSMPQWVCAIAEIVMKYQLVLMNTMRG